MVSTAPNRLLVAACLAVMLVIELAPAVAINQPAEQVLVFSARPDPKARVRSIYRVAASEPDAEASVVMTFKTGSGDIIDVYRDRYLLAKDYHALIVYRFPEGSVTRFALPSIVGDIQQIGDDTVVSLPWGRTRHANELTLLHVADEPWIENKRFLTAEPSESTKWSWVRKGAVSPDLKRAVFYLYPGPEASEPGASLVLVELETGEERILARTRYQDSPPKVWWRCDPELAWLDDHRIVFTSDPYPGDGGIPERWEPKPPPKKLVIDIMTGESLPFTSRDEKALQTQRYASYTRTLTQRFKLDQLTGGPGVISDAATGKEIFRTPTKLSRPIVSPDGHMLATSAHTEEGSVLRDLYIVDLRSGEAHRVFRGYDLAQIFWMR